MADVTYTRVYPEEVITLVNKLIALLQSEYSLSICEYKKIFHYLAIHLLADKSKILMLNPAITSFFPQQEVSKIAHLCYSTAYKLSEEFMYHILIWLYLNGKLEEMKYVDNSDNTIKSLNERFIKDFEEHFKPLETQVTLRVSQELNKIHFNLLYYPMNRFNEFDMNIYFFRQTYPEYYFYLLEYINKLTTEYEQLSQSKTFLFFSYLMLLINCIPIQFISEPLKVIIDFSYGTAYNQFIKKI